MVCEKFSKKFMDQSPPNAGTPPSFQLPSVVLDLPLLCGSPTCAKLACFLQADHPLLAYLLLTLSLSSTVSHHSYLCFPNLTELRFPPLSLGELSSILHEDTRGAWYRRALLKETPVPYFARSPLVPLTRLGLSWPSRSALWGPVLLQKSGSRWLS